MLYHFQTQREGDKLRLNKVICFLLQLANKTIKEMDVKLDDLKLQVRQELMKNDNIEKVFSTVKTSYSVTRYNRIFNTRHLFAGNRSVSIKIPSL